MQTRFRVVTLVLLILLLAVTLGGVPVAAAAEPDSFRNVKLSIFPEYDDPRLLVILGGEIVGTTPPATVRFLVPEDAEMYSAGSIDLNGDYTGGPPDREPSGFAGWDEISYEVTSSVFRVEYYTPQIVGFPDRKIDYEFYSRYDIADLTVVVQQPLRSNDFSVLPAGTETTSNSFNVQVFDYDSLTAMTPLQFQISYTKSDADPSLSSAPTNGGSSTGSTSGSGGAAAITGGITGGLLLAALAAYLIFSWSSKRKPVRARARPAPRRSAAPARSAGKYCRQCGRQIEKSARFCQHCGAAQ